VLALVLRMRAQRGMVDVSREVTRYVLSLLGSLRTGNGNWEMEDTMGC
jgi:hypothetical protein